MKNKKTKKKFKFSKFKVIRNFTVLGVIILIFFTIKVHAYSEFHYKTIIVSRWRNFMEHC